MKHLLTYCFLACIAFHLRAQSGEEEGQVAGMLQKAGFIENKGQIADQWGNQNMDALFILPTPGNSIILKSNGFSYDTYVDEYSAEANTDSELILPYQEQPASFIRHYHRVDVLFENCNDNIAIEKHNALSGDLHFYTATTGESGVTDVKAYSRVIYRNVYPNIDIEFIAIDAEGGQFEYNFILQPGANMNDISMVYDGMNDVKLENGELIFDLAHGQMKERIPLSYRNDNQEKLEIEYVLKSVQNHPLVGSFNDNHSANLSEVSYRFARIGFSGHDIPISGGMTIDPTPLLLWSTYYGGPGSDYGYGICKDLNGFLLICGATSSNSLIATAGAQQTTIGSSGVQDSFVLKLDDLGIRQWCTYYGGSSLDYGRSLVCDISGNVYVAGDSESNSGISTAGSHQSVFGGVRDAYLLKLDATGIRQWATYYGGTGQEFAGDIVMDGGGNLLFVGNSGSTTSIATGGAFQTALGGLTDGFIVKFNTSGSRIWGTFVGGALTDAINAVAVDLSNNIYVVGNTVSTNAISTSGAFQTMAIGNNDAFIVKFTTTGSRLWGTYYGGAGNDIGSGITCDISDYPCISGYTQSTSGLSTAGAHQVNFGGGNYDGFVVRFNTTGARQWGTFFGGSLDDLLWNIYADDCGNMYTVGQTQSTSGIATSDTHQGTLGGLADFCVTKIEESGIVIWSTYLGGSGQEYGRSLCLDQSLDIYVTGQAASAGLSTAGAQQPSLGGGADALIFKLYTYAALPIELISFQATPLTDQSVLTFWETASELNNAFYTVERSADGKHFEVAGYLEGGGTSQIYRSYEFEDKNPIRGLSYYRLKQTDYNGQFTYSNLVAVQFNGESGLEVYPNPSQGNFRVLSPFDGSLQIYSSSGTLLHVQKSIQGINEIDLNRLPAGVYICRLSGQNETIQTRIILNQ